MDSSVKWETDMNAALTLAEKEKKPLFLDFFNPG